MADISASGRRFMHFSASSGDTVTFARDVEAVILTVSVATVSVDFNGEAAESGAVPLLLAIGTHQLFTSASTIIVGGTGTVTGVGVAR
jgi:hypothetical protein